MDQPKHEPSAKRRRIAFYRPWVQTAFLALWLWPRAWSMHWMPGCVFHCYACPLSTFACPIGVMGQFAALNLLPVLALGVLVLVGAAVGSLVCGWACPFGWAQDLLAKLPLPKFRIPTWMGYGRYAVLVGLVIVVPWVMGRLGVDYDDQPVNICTLCPAGAAEAKVPYLVEQGWKAAGEQPWYARTWSAVRWAAIDFFTVAKVHETPDGAGGASTTVSYIPFIKNMILLSLVVLAMVTFRPWCTVLCPLGGIFALFNRHSLFYLHFTASKCRACNLCRSYCVYGVNVEESINNTRCIRCLECTTCGGVEPALGPRKKADSPTPSAPQ